MCKVPGVGMSFVHLWMGKETQGGREIRLDRWAGARSEANFPATVKVSGYSVKVTGRLKT